jgi:alkanesulfonate monooxygenase SsuD/methylene tetrahydromethanopterin reductase-like flavin-dependent oxidoreductase (luciferase family)
LAFTQDRFSYDGEIFKIPETELRPAPKSRDLFSRLFGASATGPSLEMISKRGVKPLFVGNKPLSEAALDVRKVNTMRRDVGLPPCQPKNILFTYCVASKEDAAKADEYLATANRDVALAYGLDDPTNFAGVKGYESYAARGGGATAPDAAVGNASKPAPKGYDQSNLMIGTPDMIIERIIASQKACSFSEITLMPQFGTMPYPDAAASVKLFAQEVLPVIHKMDAPLHASALPEAEVGTA